MTTQNLQNILNIITDAALVAGEVILEIYDTPFDTSLKQDGSPVTIADEKAEAIILEHLKQLDIPVLAEESAAAGKIPELGDQFFVVDPLDGTKEFIKKNGEFTVNIALVEKGRPVCGIVTAPALNKGYIGSQNGAFSFEISNGKAINFAAIQVLNEGPVNVVASRSHGNPLLDQLLEKTVTNENVCVGSSLKFCLIATGQARIYPRFTPTCEWDTAAGQAVLEAAGGIVLTTDGVPLGYGKTGTNFLNPFFIAADCGELGRTVAKQMIGIK